jgi:hypothetical protein
LQERRFAKAIAAGFREVVHGMVDAEMIGL